MIGQTLALPSLLLALCGSGEHQTAEAVRQIDMLQNGDFSMEQEKVAPGLVPWWIQSGARPKITVVEGVNWLSTEGTSTVLQPIPAYAPLIEQFMVRGTVRGQGRLTIIDGLNRSASLEVGGDGERLDFEWSGAEFARALGESPTPRLSLQLEAREGVAEWTNLEFLVAFPFPSEEELRAEVVAGLHYSLDPWIELGVDRVGPRETGLFPTLFDAITGGVIVILNTGFHPVADSLLQAVQHEPDPLWTDALETFCADYLELCFHPETGIPRLWDPQLDVPKDETHSQIHIALRFLLDMHERGPEAHRPRARELIGKIAQSVLASGLLPDGNMAPLYRPRDGASSNEAVPLRRLDMPAQMTRIAALNGDERCLIAARSAVATFLYTHYWAGRWNHIDPGFDDDFGHYGARAGLMAECFPEEAIFRRVIDTGWAHFSVVWRQALRFGGSMAADQVRCWKLLLAYSELRPEIRPTLDKLLEGAVMGHLRGEQYSGGAWGDVTYYGYKPSVGLQVGDLPGTPTNLLEGIALCYGTGLGPADEDLRAIFTGVLRNSMEVYGREHGLLSTMREIDGPNHAGGSVRIAPALTEMLAKLSD